MTIENKIFSAEQFKRIDSSAIKQGISSKELMHNAAKALFARLESLDRLHGKITVICGAGNNGGDGYALATLLISNGINFEIVAADHPKSEDSCFFFDRCLNEGKSVICGKSEQAYKHIKESDVIVDCLFGFSFHGETKGVYLSLIEAINSASSAFVLSADLPSGIAADSDEINTLCVKANATCTFSAHKIATASNPAYQYCGKVFVEDIGIPKEIFESEQPIGCLSDASLLSLIPQRKEDSHKGTYGTLAALVGTKSMSGAAYMAVLSALKSGVGLAKILTEEQTSNILRLKLPEALIFSTADEETENLLFWKNNDAYLLGCGCAKHYDSLFETLLPTLDKPTVVDADGINYLANHIKMLQSINAELILTPHPGEMARLLGKTPLQVNSSRVLTAKNFSTAFKTVTLLKGNRTVVASPDGRLFINTSGCSALSKGGSGDVLAGLIASLLAQGVPAFEAACLGAYLHGLAAEENEKSFGAYAALPSELPQTIGKLMQIGDTLAQTSQHPIFT